MSTSGSPEVSRRRLAAELRRLREEGLAVDSFQILEFGRAHETRLPNVVSAESLSGYLYVEGETDAYEFRRAFEHLAQEALGPDESRELILQTARQLWALSAEVR